MSEVLIIFFVLAGLVVGLGWLAYMALSLNKTVGWLVSDMVDLGEMHGTMGRDDDDGVVHPAVLGAALGGRVTATEARLDARMSTLQDHESRIDDAFAAISGMHKRIGVAVKDADIARGLAMQPVSEHATCALCGKVGHVADMEGMGWEDCLELALDGAPVIKPIPTDAPSHFHPECLVSAGCERVEAVAGGWRRKVVEE